MPAPLPSSRAWLGVTLVLLLALLVQPLGQGHLADGPWRAALDWQPDRALSQPWRWWTPVAAHLSAQHWLANAAGVVLVGVLGWSARVPSPAAWAWCAAWPLTHLALGLRPELLRYAGASGMLHAGVAVTAVWLLWWGQGPLRWIGALTGGGLVLKVLIEAPWGPVLQAREGWDILIVPWSHASGTLAGGVCALLTSAWLRWRGTTDGVAPDRLADPG